MCVVCMVFYTDLHSAWLLSPLKMELGMRDQSCHEEVETELWEVV
jgi:hypothetical protein